MTSFADELYRTRHARRRQRQWKARAFGTCVTYSYAGKFWIWTRIRQPSVLMREMP